MRLHLLDKPTLSADRFSYPSCLKMREEHDSENEAIFMSSFYLNVFPVVILANRKVADYYMHNSKINWISGAQLVGSD